MELPKASKKISPNILSRLGLHTTVSLLGEMSRARKRQAPTMMATGQIASVALLARRTSDLVVDGVCRRTTKAARAVSAVANRNASDQHRLLWTSGRPVLTVSHRVPNQRINGHRQLFDQNSILAHGQFDLGRH